MCAYCAYQSAPTRFRFHSLACNVSRKGKKCAAFLVFLWGGISLATDVVNVPGCFVLLTGCWHHASPPPHSPPFPFRPL